MNNYFIYAVIAVGIFTVYMAIVHLVRGDRMKARLKNVTGGGVMEQETSSSALASMCEGLLSMFGLNVKDRKELTLELAQAGIHSPHAVTYTLFFRRIVQPVLLVLGGLVFLKMVLTPEISGLDRIFKLMVALLLMGIGLYGATLYISNRRQHRQQILLRSFPELLDLLLVCIESGLGLDAALARTGSELQETRPLVASEIDRTRMELTVLSDRSQALQNLAERTGIVPFKSLVAALIQTEKFGTSLVDTLRVLSEDERQTRLLNIEARAAKLPVWITIPLVLCFLPAFIMIILGPPIIKVMNQGGIFGPGH